MSTLERVVIWFGRPPCPSRRCGADGGDLRSDRSGAIMVAGVFMAALLAAALFYIIGTGNAIIYRERAQDAADAIAYTSAGVHARGMNLIVLINLIMAALLAVLVFMRMLIVMIGLFLIACAAAIACCASVVGSAVCCPIASLCSPFMSPAGKLVNALNNGAQKYEKVLNVVLPALSKLEMVIAMTTPYVGAYKGYKVAGQYKGKVVTGGLAVSPSMIPFVPEKKKLGLPVQEMKYDEFCQKAAELGVKNGFDVINLPGLFESLLEKFAGFLAKTFSGYFCGDKGGKTDIDSIIDNNINDLVNDSCKEAKQDCTKNGASDKNKYCSDDGSGKVSFDDSKCKKETKEEIDKNNKVKGQKGKIDPGSGKAFDFKNKTPKEIWNGAQHGDFWFQVYGIATSDKKWPRNTDRGLAIATKGGQMPKVDMSWGTFRFAEAEFYFDDEGKWKDLRDECMWKMYWRARLRRFYLGDLDVVSWGGGKIVGKFTDLVSDYIGDKLSKYLEGNSASVVFSGLTKGLYDDISKKLSDALKDWVKGGAKKVDGKLESWIMPSWEVIH